MRKVFAVIETRNKFFAKLNSTQFFNAKFSKSLPFQTIPFQQVSLTIFGYKLI